MAGSIHDAAAADSGVVRKEDNGGGVDMAGFIITLQPNCFFPIETRVVVGGERTVSGVGKYICVNNWEGPTESILSGAEGPYANDTFFSSFSKISGLYTIFPVGL